MNRGRVTRFEREKSFMPLDSLLCHELGAIYLPWKGHAHGARTALLCLSCYLYVHDPPTPPLPPPLKVEEKKI